MQKSVIDVEDRHFPFQLSEMLGQEFDKHYKLSFDQAKTILFFDCVLTLEAYFQILSLIPISLYLVNKYCNVNQRVLIWGLRAKGQGTEGVV